MKLVTWNVNSVRARLPRLLPWLKEKSPDVVALQETKCLDEAFPREEIEDLGYSVETFGQKTYNGVAFLSKRPIEVLARGLPGDGEDSEKRVIAALVDGVVIVDVYVVNGKSVGDPKYDYKLQWMERLRAWMAEEWDTSEPAILCGDFNVTFDDRDIHDPKSWHEKILCSTPERQALGRIVDLGYADALRHHHEEGEIYTWWDFRTRAFRRNRGLRIDHFLMSAPALESCRDVWVDLEARDGEKPSDHAPVWAELER